MKVLRVLALGLGGLVVVVLALLVAFGVSGYNAANTTCSNPVPTPRVAADSSLLPRGRHLATVLCASCHSPNMQLPLAGGSEDFLKIPNESLGHLYAPNLTPGGRLREYSDGELSRAIREGVSKEGKPLLVMPSRPMHELSDRDLAAITTYLRSQPEVAGVVPRRQLSWMACLILGAHAFETSHTLPVTHAIADTPESMGAEYGGYITQLLDCRSCHGSDLKGGRKGQFPPIGPNLLALVAAHDLGQFDGALRRGMSARDGHSLDPTQMPYLMFANLTDTEVGAIYAYLQSQAKK